MNILIDADGCPVVDLTLQIAKQFSVPVIILCDVSHPVSYTHLTLPTIYSV